MKLTITKLNGNAIQDLHYLLFGEDWVDQRNSSWNAPYTFSGKEKDAETGYGYFGARYYDSGLSIWLSVDPMSDKYPSMSPYNYCTNNPVIIKDPDGKDIIIYDENNRKVATITKYGTTFEKGMDKNNKAYQNYKASENYVKGKTDVFDVLIKSDSKVNIHMGNDNSATNGTEGRYLPNGNKAANEVNIIWDPKSNLVIPQGGENSPAVNLLHECIHARNMVTDFSAYEANHNNTKVQYNYDNMEEYNTIQEVNSIVKTNFKYSEGVRQDHRGKSGPNTYGVTSTLTVPSKIKPQWTIQDNNRMPITR